LPGLNEPEPKLTSDISFGRKRTPIMIGLETE
jgi:hypothetical protein